MNGKWIIFYLILFCVAGSYALSGQRHEFLSDECGLCHTNEINDPGNLKPAVTQACETCHTDQKEIQTHPTDIYPTLSIPKDMTLIEGRMTCITCHYVHPKKGKSSRKGLYFLRRQIRGQLFCAICHEIDEKGHIIKDDVHTGSYKEEDSTTRLDMISLECIECHDTLMREDVSSLGAGTVGAF